MGRSMNFGAGLAASSAVFACLIAAPAALATHGPSHDPEPSGTECEWYGSVEHDYYQWSQSDEGTGSLRRQGSGWSGPSDDPTCRGTVHESYVAHQTQSEGWYHQEAEGTVTATYSAGWEGSEPGGFGAYFTGDESVTGERTDFTGGDAGTFELTPESRAYCVVPAADTAAKRAKIQAVVITCSSESPGNQSTTSTIRMRRTNCDQDRRHRRGRSLGLQGVRLAD